MPLRLSVLDFPIAALLALLSVSGALAAETTPTVRLGVITRPVPPVSTYDPDAAPEDDGLAGGRLGIADDNTTGRFTGLSYALEERSLGEGEDAIQAARDLLAKDVRFVVLALPAPEVLAVADALEGEDALVFNAGAADDNLRGADCRAKLFNVAPSRAMLTDALAQFFAVMRWRRLFLVVGPKANDRLYADSVRRSARKFGLAIADEKPWTFGPLARTKGDSPTLADAFVFTRGIDYDVAVVADEDGDWGDYLPFHTVDPRPVGGTQGLIATTWHPTLEVWGAAQAQNRFRRLAGRLMRSLDYQVWAAVRSVGEAVTQTKRGDPKSVAAFLVDPAFSLAGYKGAGLSYRPWDRQLRQPLLVVQPRALVTVAPERGFLHQRTPLDTLGFDEPESACKVR